MISRADVQPGSHRAEDKHDQRWQRQSSAQDNGLLPHYLRSHFHSLASLPLPQVSNSTSITTLTSNALLPFIVTFNASNKLVSTDPGTHQITSMMTPMLITHLNLKPYVPPTLIIAEVIAVPLLQQFRICTSCGGNATHIPHHTTLGSCRRCGLSLALVWVLPRVD